MILGLQLIAIIFALIMIYLAYVHYSRGELNGLEILSWMTIWILTIVIVIFPDLLRTFTQTFSISRVFDMMVVGGFIVTITLIYLAYVKTNRIENTLEKLIRTEALAKMNLPERKLRKNVQKKKGHTA
ncbi:DUF2304 domain-containing protein [Patescibacteria group bacterium]|nr:DUF2304 domain-containing protein [Patescibacteria group bacterium]MCL5409296.1 DUF2304 domain-containing protein [Patescibacteria group bacterium]